MSDVTDVWTDRVTPDDDRDARPTVAHGTRKIRAWNATTRRAPRTGACTSATTRSVRPSTSGSQARDDDDQVSAERVAILFHYYSALISLQAQQIAEAFRAQHNAA